MKRSSNNYILTKAYQDFSRGLSCYAALKVSNKALSDDLVQTTFLRTWAYLQKKGKIDLMRAFLYHALKGLIIDEYRRHKTISLDVLAENGLELETIDSENIYNVIDGKALALLIEKLPDKYRTVITMRFVEELTLKEISAVAHQSPNTTSAQVHRGLSKLRVLYAATGVHVHA